MTPRPHLGDRPLITVLERSRALGFLGPGPIEKQLDHARAFVDLVEDGERVLDLGSGGGLPGLVLLMYRHDLDMILLDAHGRRTAFLCEAIDELGVNARVECGRAEDLGRRPDLRASVDVVTSRSFGPPAVTAECAAPFLRVGGRLLVSEPPSAQGRWNADACGRLGLSPTRLHVAHGATIQDVAQLSVCPDDYPRRNGVPGRRPLW